MLYSHLSGQLAEAARRGAASQSKTRITADKEQARARSEIEHKARGAIFARSASPRAPSALLSPFVLPT